MYKYVTCHRNIALMVLLNVQQTKYSLERMKTAQR